MTVQMNQTFQIFLNVDNAAAFVWFETNIDGYFNDNGLLIPMQTQDSNIIFYARKNTTTVDELQSSLYVYSLYEAGGFKNN